MDSSLFSSKLKDLLNQLNNELTQNLAPKHSDQLKELILDFKIHLTFDQTAVYILGRPSYEYLVGLLDLTLCNYYGQEFTPEYNNLLKACSDRYEQQGNIKWEKLGSEKRSNLGSNFNFFNDQVIQDTYIKQKLGKLSDHLKKFESLFKKKSQVISILNEYPPKHATFNNNSIASLKHLWRQALLVYQNTQNQTIQNITLTTKHFFKINHFLALIEKYVTEISAIITKILSVQKSSAIESQVQSSIKQKKSQKKSLLTQIMKEAQERNGKGPQAGQNILNEYKMQKLSKKRKTQPSLFKEISYRQPRKEKKQIKVSLQNCGSCSQCIIF